MYEFSQMKEYSLIDVVLGIVGVAIVIMASGFDIVVKG